MYLAFLDILGFKEIVKNNKIDEVYNLYNIFLNGNIKEIFEDFEKEDIANYKTKYLFLSDSIIVYTADETPESFIDIVTIVCLFLYRAILTGFPLRGAITNGDLKDIIHDNTNVKSYVLLGKPIVEAFNLEKAFDWSGCVVSSEVIKSVKNSDALLKLEDKKILTKYMVPKKEGKIEDVYVINWIPKGINKSENDLNGFFEDHNKSLSDWRAYHKYANTLNFFKSMCKLRGLTFAEMSKEYI